MKDKYRTDRRDPAIKRLERQGLIDMAAASGAPLEVLRELYPARRKAPKAKRRSRLVSGVLLAILLSQVPGHAFTKKDFYDAARRWEHGSYCQGMFKRGWFGETIAFFSGC